MGNFGSLPGDKKFKHVKTQKASFGMQCFWQADAHFGLAPGVVRTRVGYSGGTTKSPTYEKLGDHTETVEVEYDPTKTDYDALLAIFWAHSNHTSNYKIKYQSVIFTHTPEQRRRAEQSLLQQQRNLLKPIVTKIVQASKFYEAQTTDQKYRLKLHENLVKMLNVPASALTNSHVAARLNGYVTTDGTIEMFEAEKDELQLSPKVVEYIRKLKA